MRSLLIAIAACAACNSQPSGSSPPEPPAPPPSPLAGSAQRFAVDRVVVPSTTADIAAMCSDPDGAAVTLGGNGLAGLIASLASANDAGSDGADLIRSGALAGSIVLTAGSGGQVGVSIDGAAQLRAARRGSDQIATDQLQITPVPIQVPAFADADPASLVFDAAAVQLVPDGGSGYTVYLQGLIDVGSAKAVATAGLIAMVTNNPGAHHELYALLDQNCDGVVTAAEVAQSSAIDLVQDNARDAATVGLPDGFPDQVGFCYGLHVVPCAAGACADAPIVDHCEDRVRDGDETGVDCGGGCAPCSAGVACGSDSDCDSQSCAGGACAAPSCNDGIEDGFEDAVDCGGGCGSACFCSST